MPHLLTDLHVTPRQIGAVAFGLAAAVSIGLYAYLRRRPDPEEIERLRRRFLATEGRITDATLIDTTVAQQSDPGPLSTLQYQYRVAGVIYESSQDVSSLPSLIRQVRVDLPIQIRYDPHNPGNSIVVAESWSGLRLDAAEHHVADSDATQYPPEV